MNEQIETVLGLDRVGIEPCQGRPELVIRTLDRCGR